MKPNRKNMGESVRQRLLNQTRQTGDNYQLLLTRYTLERLLYRLSQSPHCERFVLKGAALYALWSAQAPSLPYRPTRDLDLWSRDSPLPAAIATIFREVLEIGVEDDGLEFLLDTLQVEPMREEEKYAGCRLVVKARLVSALINVQIDFGFGDAITPSAQTVTYPTILPESDAPILRVYPRETVLAEKFEAMVLLSLINTRLKDFFDVWTISNYFEIDGETLRLALQNTFARRQTPLPTELPTALTPAFTDDATKIATWKSFGRRSEIENLPALSSVTARIEELLWPVAQAARTQSPWLTMWHPTGGWRQAPPDESPNESNEQN